MKVFFDIFIFFKNKGLCLLNRTFLNLLLFDIDVDPWHINGTYFCRKYKMIAVKEINHLKPSLFIDIGCGLGEVVSRIKIPKNKRYGLDVDSRLDQAIKRVNPSKFNFFTSREALINSARLNLGKKNGPIVISLLGFTHTLTEKELLENLNFFLRELGPYILVIDAKEPSQRSDSHINLFERQEGIIKLLKKIDQIRSLYFIDLSISPINR